VVDSRPWMPGDDHELDGDPFPSSRCATWSRSRRSAPDGRARRGPHRRARPPGASPFVRRPGERLVRRPARRTRLLRPPRPQGRPASCSNPTSNRGRPRTNLPTGTLLMEAMRRVDEISHLRDALPSYARVAFFGGASQDAAGGHGPGASRAGASAPWVTSSRGRCTRHRRRIRRCCRPSRVCASRGIVRLLD